MPKSLKEDQIFIMEKAANIILSSLNNLLEMIKQPEEIRRVLGKEVSIDLFYKVIKYS